MSLLTKSELLELLGLALRNKQDLDYCVQPMHCGLQYVLILKNQVPGSQELLIKVKRSKFIVAFSTNPEDILYHIPVREVTNNTPRLMEWLVQIHALTQTKNRRAKVEMEFA